MVSTLLPLGPTAAHVLFDKAHTRGEVLSGPVLHIHFCIWSSLIKVWTLLIYITFRKYKDRFQNMTFKTESKKADPLQYSKVMKPMHPTRTANKCRSFDCIKCVEALEQLCKSGSELHKASGSPSLVFGGQKFANAFVVFHLNIAL